VDSALEAALRFAVRSPEEALLLVAEPDVGEAGLMRVPKAFNAFLVELLRSGRVSGAVAASSPRLTEQALIGALRSLIAARLVNGKEKALPALKDELVQLVLTPYLGPGPAIEFAQRH
jgi:hypothetical protein